MARRRSTYHHQDVPRAAREAALELLSRPGADFTLQEVARTLGVTHPALYRHFRGRRGLLAAVAAEGYAAFGALLARRTKGLAGEPLLVATFRTYFDYATKQPGHFRALFHPDLRDKSDLPELEAAALASLGGLGRILSGVGVGDPGPRAAALCWASMHGLALLWGDGWLPGRTGLSTAEARTLPESLARTVYAGLAAAPSRVRAASRA